MIIKLYDVEKSEIVSDRYANKDISVPVDLDDGLQYYFIENDAISNPNHNQYYIERGSIELTDEEHPDYPHILKAVQTYSLVEYSSVVVLAELKRSFGEWVDNEYLPQTRTKHSDELAGIYGEVSEERTLYIKSCKSWYYNLIIEYNNRVENYTNNNVFPSFEWESKPVE